MRHKLTLLLLLLVALQPSLMAQQNKGAKSKVRYKAKSFGVPAWPYPIEETQPDSTNFTYYLKGDGAVHWHETIDGYPIIKNNKDFFEYVKIAPDKKVVPSGVRASADINRRNANERSYLRGLKRGVPYSAESIQEMRDSYAPASAESEPSKALGSSGTMNLLLLLVEFPDAAHSHDTLEFDSLMNLDDYHGTGSFRDFYYENSYGDLSVVTTVSGWYMAPHEHDYYADDSDPTLDTARHLVRHIVDSAEAHGMDFSPYDNDLDGYVDGIMVIHQGIGAEHGDGTCIWSHSWGLNDLQVQYDGVWIQRYTINPEERPVSSTDTVMNGIGTACHEFGHNLGLPDFYDTDYGGSGGQSEHLGYWDCMASGSYNNSSNTPAHHNAYSKELLGWLTISELNSAASVTLMNVEQNMTAYKYYTTTAGEYFLLENRQKIGFDEYIPGHGLLIYHVDQNYIDANRYYINADPSHQGFDLEEADGTPAHDPGDAFPGTSNNQSFTDTTTPNSISWADENTNKPVTNIQETSQVLYFDIMGGSTSPTITNVVHIPSTPSDEDSVQIQADITDNGTITSAALEWCTDGTSFGNTIAMSNTSGNMYQTVTDIPPHSTGTTVSYRIEATDDNSETTTTPAFSYTVAIPSYCEAGGIGDSYEGSPTEYISNVQVGDINNSSTQTASLSPNPNYTDYTGISTDMNRGIGYSFSVSIVNSWSTDQVLIWIDWNRDYDFYDTGEEVFASSTGTGPFTGTIIPPSGATPGNTRMRIRLHDTYNGPNATPCGNSNWGEVEDYTVNILPSEPVIENVTHIPANPTEINSVSVEADITDGDGTISSALLKWCTDGILFNNTIDMSGSGDTYKTNSDIPVHTIGITVSYKVFATDNDDNTTESSVYSYTVDPAPNMADFPYSESFETDFGDWVQLTDDDFNWTRDENGTPTNSTGPGSAQDGNWYIYTEANNPNNPNKKANLECIFDLRTAVTPLLSFYYHMYGSGTGTLEIRASIDQVQWTTLFSMSGDQGNAWHQFEVDISQFAGEIVYMQILGTTGSSRRGDMALDNIVIDNYTIEFIKGPYLQKVTDNSIVIMWETGAAADSRVDYGISAPNENNVQDASPVTIHEMQLTGLTPDTRYYYTVTSNGTTSATYTFSTAPATERDFRFAAYGDIQRETPIHGTVVDGIKGYNPEFVFHTGDMVNYGKDYEQWAPQFFNQAQALICSTAFFPELGNHDYWPTSSSADMWFDDFFSLPNNEEWYAYTYSNTRFIALNTNEVYTPGSTQYNWLESELQSAEFTNATWHIVYFHHPPFTSSRHTDDPDVKAYLVPLFEQYGVDMVFSGHSHLYERYNNNGIYYFVIGGGGQELDELVTDTQEPIRQVGAEKHHYCIFDVDVPSQSLALSVWDVDGIPVDNVTLYKHTVTFIAGSNGSITGNLVQVVKHGGNCTEVEAVPDANYHFDNWTGDYSGTENPLTVTNVTSDMTITANFVQSGSITVSDLSTEADVYIHATNGWQGIKARDGSGPIIDLKPGIHILSARELGKRTELVYVTVTPGIVSPVSISLKDAIPVIFAAKDTVKDKNGDPINHGVTNSTVMDDIDRDEDVDLVVAEVYGDINYYLNNSGFELDRTVTLPLGGAERVRCIRCADIGSDGERELIVALNTGEMFSLDITSDSETPFYSAGNELTGFDLFEGNDDGYPDLLLGYADGTLKMALSTGSGTWDTRQDVTLPGAAPLDVGDTATPLLMDIDGDGIKDLVTGNTFGDVRWYKGSGTAEFTARDTVNSGGMPLITNGNSGISITYNTTMHELPFAIVTDEDGFVYQLPAILLGDVNNDGKVFIDDFSIFVEFWGLDDNDPGWNADVNFDVTPNGSDDQEIDLSDFTLFNDSWRKEK